MAATCNADSLLLSLWFTDAPFSMSSFAISSFPKVNIILKPITTMRIEYYLMMSRWRVLSITILSRYKFQCTKSFPIHSIYYLWCYQLSCSFNISYLIVLVIYKLGVYLFGHYSATYRFQLPQKMLLRFLHYFWVSSSLLHFCHWKYDVKRILLT